MFWLHGQDMSRQPPTQELVAKDLHGVEWRFRHIFRGDRSTSLLFDFDHIPRTCSPLCSFACMKELQTWCQLLFVCAVYTEFLCALMTP